MSLDASTRCTGHVSGRDGHPNISFQATRRAKATTNADATINTCQSCVPPTFRSDLLKHARRGRGRQKHAGCCSMVQRCGKAALWHNRLDPSRGTAKNGSPAFNGYCNQLCAWRSSRFRKLYGPLCGKLVHWVSVWDSQSLVRLHDTMYRQVQQLLSAKSGRLCTSREEKK